MIKNNNQYKRTQTKIEEMQTAKTVFIKDSSAASKAHYEFAINSFDSIISDLLQQTQEYENLCDGGLKILQPKSIEDIPRTIIQARIALGYKQKDFAEKVGLKEQQIQRYEAEDYQGVSFDRLIDFADVLGLTFNIQKIFIKAISTNIFTHNDEISAECIVKATEQIKERRSLLMA